MSGIADDDGVELASNFSSRKNARNIFIPASTVVREHAPTVRQSTNQAISSKMMVTRIIYVI